MKADKMVDPRERTIKDLKAYLKGEIDNKREIVLLMPMKVQTAEQKN